MNPATMTAEQIQVFLLIFVRVVSIIALLPVIGSLNVPSQFKVGISFALSILIFPYVDVPAGITRSFDLMLFSVVLIKEIFIGITIGFTCLFLMGCVQFAGMHIDNQIGFSMAQVVDPFSDEPSTVAGQYYTLIFSIIFLLVNGHYFLFLALVKSFDLIPLLSMNFAAGPLVDFFSMLVSRLFILSLQLSAPVYAVLLISSIALGVVARTVPQMNVFFVGVPLKIALGLGAMAVSLPALSLFFRGLTEILVEDIWKLLYIIS